MGWENSFVSNAAEPFGYCWCYVRITVTRWLQRRPIYGPALPIGSIRVLELLPGKIGDPISCVLQAKTLHEADGTYDAISYRWGSGSQPRTISCNGRPFSIGPNLFETFQYFRHAKVIRCLWADAICIN